MAPRLANQVPGLALATPATPLASPLDNITYSLATVEWTKRQETVLEIAEMKMLRYSYRPALAFTKSDTAVCWRVFADWLKKYTRRIKDNKTLTLNRVALKTI